MLVLKQPYPPVLKDDLLEAIRHLVRCCSQRPAMFDDTGGYPRKNMPPMKLYEPIVEIIFTIINHYLVGGFFATPLKNDGVRQLGWWNSQYDGKNKIHVPNHKPVIHCMFPWFRVFGKLVHMPTWMLIPVVTASEFCMDWSFLVKKSYVSGGFLTT